MEVFWRIIYFSFAFGIGFVNPLITFGMIAFYYLSSLIDSIIQDNDKIIINIHQASIEPSIDEYSKEIQEEMK